MPVFMPPPTRLPEDPAVDGTRSFEAPGTRRPRRVKVAPVQAEARTRRGTPRPAPDRIPTSVRVITGDYPKIDDNEVPRHRAPSHPVLHAITPREAAAARPATVPGMRALRESVAEGPAPTPTDSDTTHAVRQAWLQGAAVGALLLAIAWVSWLIAKSG